MVYGMLLESVQYFLQLEYGEDVWHDVLEKSSLARNTVFSTHQIYPDTIIADIATACAELTGYGSTKNDFFEFFGRCFVRFWSHYGYDKFVRASGRTFRDFLQGVDNIHHQMRFGYPKMMSPSMFVTKEHPEGALLHYKSKRAGFATYVIGQLTQVASDFYDIDLAVEIVETYKDAKHASNTTVFSLKFENTAFVTNLQDQLMREKAVSKLPAVPSALFFSLFPFCVIFDKNMIVVNAGVKLKALIDANDFVGHSFEKYLIIRRPKIEVLFDEIAQLQNVFFEIQVNKKVKAVAKPSIVTPDENPLPGATPNGVATTEELSKIVVTGPAERRGSGSIKPLLLRGRMHIMPEWHCLAFICMPLISSLDELQELSLFLTDLSMHDLSREMVLAGWQHNANLEVTFEKQEERSQRLEESLNLLDQWKQRGDELLYTMIPQTVADKLRNGGDPISTCQSFEQVTILFSELIMANQDSMAPMEIVTCMNAVFSAFDSIMDRYDVYKVETIGQIYMCVSGAPDPNVHHATSSARAALAMLKDMHGIQESSEAYSQCSIRIGMSSGPVVAGVVGLKMPRYCMFGDTVNTASRMESTSLPWKVHVSEHCKKFLEETEFSVEYRGLTRVKGKGDMRTYWLVTPDMEKERKK